MSTFDTVLEVTKTAMQPIVDIAESVKVSQAYGVPPIELAGDALAKVFGSPTFPYRVENVDLSDAIFWQAAVMIMIQPLMWNVIGWFEYYTRFFSRLIKPSICVNAVALWIFILGLFRNSLFVAAIDRQEKVEWLATTAFKVAGSFCILFGATLVLSSFYRLGVSGTFLGDYFGILMEEKVTAFPFNILADPMYDGSTLLFLGKAITAESVAGILLSCWVYIVYRLASLVEGPFTAYVYAQKASKQKSS